MTEAELQAAIIDMARLLRWKVAHFGAARTQTGWETPVRADAQGFPDLVFVRERVMYAELKSARGRVTPYQEEWHRDFRNAGQELYLWRPVDWESGRVEYVLRHVGRSLGRLVVASNGDVDHAQGVERMLRRS